MSTLTKDLELSDKLVQAALSDPTLTLPTFSSSRVFALLSLLLSSPSVDKKKLVRRIKTTYVFEVENEKGEKGRWWVDMKKQGRIRLLPGESKAPSKPDVQVKLGDKDLVGLVTGRLSPQKLYEAKRLHIKGNLDRAFLAMRILNTEREKLERLVPNSPTSNPALKEKKEIWGEYKGKSAKSWKESALGSGGAVKAKL
ncbi:hypothetical protein JCM11641_002105 [Rhodosporidiobolus odoratus]